MSKISLTPNASGTGTFSIASPNSNTNRTITLPDEAGELLVNGTTSNVGIGTSSPSSPLDINAADGVADNAFALRVQNLEATDDRSYGVYIQAGSTSVDSALAISDHTGANSLLWVAGNGNVGIGTSSPSFEAGSGGGLEVNYSAGLGSHIKLTDSASGAGGSNGFDLYAFNTSGYIENYEAGSIIFRNGGNERMRITAAGGIQIGTASAIASGDAAQWNMMNGSTGVFHRFLWAGATLGSITINGGATAYNTSSDYRLKTDAQPMVGASARVQALNPVNFEWIVDGTRVDGFLAHEAQAVVPESVTGTKDAMMDEEYEVTAAIEATYDDDGNEITAAVDAVMGTRSVPDYQGIDQSKLVPLLTAALQEALTEIASLKTRVQTLEGV